MRISLQICLMLVLCCSCNYYKSKFTKNSNNKDFVILRKDSITGTVFINKQQDLFEEIILSDTMLQLSFLNSGVFIYKIKKVNEKEYEISGEYEDAKRIDNNTRGRLLIIDSSDIYIFKLDVDSKDIEHYSNAFLAVKKDRADKYRQNEIQSKKVK